MLYLKRQFGFSLIEMMITIVVGAIILILAVPNIQRFVDRDRQNTYSYALMDSFRLARSEALNRSLTVSVCAKSGPSTLSCGGSSDWINGWMIFYVDPSSTATVVLKQHPVLGSRHQMTAANGTVSFAASGQKIGASENFLFSTQDCAIDENRQINVSTLGHVSDNTTACS